jgi:lysophospholipase L1-like esterase
LIESVSKLIKNKEKPLKWVFYGDSITHGVFHTFGKRDYTELFEERIRCELARTQDIVINSAISGNTTRPLLKSFEWRVGQFKPDVVFLMIGMNDCSDNNDISLTEFEDNLCKLAKKINELGSVMVLQTTCPILPGTSPERLPNFDNFMDVIRKVANDKKIALIDHNRFWHENIDKLYYWMSNAFHPNGEGHIAFAHYLFKEIGIFNDDTNTCRLFVP